MITLATTEQDVELLLKVSPLLEAEKNAHKKTALKLNTVVKGLWIALDEFEGRWDSDEQCDSVEIAEWYVTYAKYLKAHFRRDDAKRIQYVQEWIDNYLPWK